MLRNLKSPSLFLYKIFTKQNCYLKSYIIYVYVYIYTCVCVCVCVFHLWFLLECIRFSFFSFFFFYNGCTHSMWKFSGRTGNVEVLIHSTRPGMDPVPSQQPKPLQSRFFTHRTTVETPQNAFFFFFVLLYNIILLHLPSLFFLPDYGEERLI